MDLKDVVNSVREEADEAHKAFHAGHPEKTLKRFKVIMESIRAYFNQMSPAEVAELSEATSEPASEKIEDVQAEVSAPGVQPAVIDPDAAAQRKAIDQAGP